MVDEAGADEKLIAVPSNHISQMYAKVNSIHDLPEIQLKQIAHFFERYKDLEDGKWVKLDRWGDAEEAKAAILKAIEADKAS